MTSGRVFRFLTAICVCAFGGFIANAPASSAHAIIELNGVSAVAGKSSAMTLEIQHGCLTESAGTTQVIAFVGKPWGAVKPGSASGWKVSVAPLADGGQQITWSIVGNPNPFGTPVYFPMTVKWPNSPGVYGMRVLQVCPGGLTWWDTPFTPATAAAPSPPLTPLPQVQVLARPGSTDAQTTDHDPTSGAAHSGH